MKINELRQEIENKTTELATKIEARDVEGAKALKKEIEEARELLKIAEEQETEEREKLENQKKEERGTEKMEKVKELRAVAKVLRGEELTPEERAVIKSGSNGAVIPKEFINELQKIEKGYGSLKEYCDVITVTKPSGTVPVIDMEQGDDIPDVLESDAITEGSLSTTDMDFSVKKVGEIFNFSNESLDDAEQSLERLARENLAIRNTRIINKGIATILSANATEVANASLKKLQTGVDEVVPALRNGLVTVTNTTGYAYLNNLTDKQDRPLNLVTEVNGKFYFKGKELVIMDDEILKPATDGNVVFYVSNLKEAVKIFDRKQFTIAKSTEAGFETDSTKIRMLERFDMKKGASTRSLKKFEYTPA